VIQVAHADFKTVAFLADEIFGRNRKVIEGQLPGRGSMRAQLVKIATV
jgi:hypothetical protein